ncbi:hypothetical protein BJV78DRAFT_1282460 [Lactifluus subvellereus]|nr:hypothetical protein BJV78DRAFT_1282460 [Lactifluus subvellereus]
MVTIRRAPAAPRTSSQGSDSPPTAVSSSKATAPHHTPHVPEQSTLLANGKPREDSHDGSSEDRSRDTGGLQSKKNKRGKKPKNGEKKRKDKHANLADVLLRYLLLFFTIYSLSVCPHDAELQSPVCRGLSEYRRLILEPYIFPAVNNALSHPSVLPYVDRAKPFVNRAIQVASPVVLHTQREWNHRIVPQWNKVIVPQFRKYLTPQLERASALVQPYLFAAEERYESLLGPHVRLTAYTANKYQRAVRPYILLAADRTYSGYQTARPYFRPVWQHIKHILKQLLIFLRAQRRQFVDPHVAKIWERIKELSRSDDEAFTGQSTSAPSVSRVPVETAVDSDAVQAHSEKLERVESSYSFADTPAHSSSVSPPSDSSLVSHPSRGPDFADEAGYEMSSSATSSPMESSSVPPHSSPPQESSPSPTSSPSSTPTILPHLDDDVDMGAFFADIGFNVEEPEPEAPKEDVYTEPPSLDEEQLEELRLKKLAETAEKRRDIMDRHTKWEEKLDKVINEKKKALRKALVAMRKAAVQELETNTNLQSAVDELVENAEKFLNGAEAYLINLKKESRTADEKVALWTKVLDKVATKFTELLHRTEVVIHEWYNAHLEKEIAEVKQLTEEVRAIADSAQADVGYDYIWLDDVTYHDWQRYHALLGKSNNFTDLAISIQDGTHPSPPINPISSAVYELQLELQDVIADFETRFRRIKRNGLKAIGSLPGDMADEEEAEAEQDVESLQPPQVSILPVPSDDESDHAAPILRSDFPVIGRGKAEVEEAVARAEDVLDRGDSQEEVAGSSADEINEVGPGLVTSTTVPSSTSPPLHAEL